MQKLIDPVFGQLLLDYSWYQYRDIKIFDKSLNVLCRVEADLADEITESQRAAFLDYIANEKMIISKVENAVIEYKKNQLVEIAQNNTCNGIHLNHVCFLYSGDKSKKKIGFVFDDAQDPELGIGVLVINGEVEDIGVQDIVL